MREIKFRAWDKIGNCWVQDHLLQDFVSVGVPEGEKDNGVLNLIGISPRVELMQFTGLKDKNGKEIYEGDIVEQDGGLRGEIVFYAGGFYFEDKRTNMTQMAVFGHGTGIEVIGNIYDNPALSTGAKGDV